MLLVTSSISSLYHLLCVTLQQLIFIKNIRKWVKRYQDLFKRDKSTENDKPMVKRKKDLNQHNYNMLIIENFKGAIRNQAKRRVWRARSTSSINSLIHLTVLEMKLLTYTILMKNKYLKYVMCYLIKYLKIQFLDCLLYHGFIFHWV